MSITPYRPKPDRWNAKPRSPRMMEEPLTKLESLILDRNLFDYEVANAIGVVAPRISDWKSGRRAIPPKHLISLSKFFSCQPDDILGYVDTPPRNGQDK